MENAFEAKPISDDSLRPAHAVLQLGFPHMTLRECRDLKARCRDAGAKTLGLMGLFDRRGYVHAVFRCRKEPFLPSGMRLKVSDFVVSDLIASAMLSHMVDALERLAHLEGCDHMTVEAPQSTSPDGIHLLNTLVSHGFSRDGVMLARHF